MAVTVKNAVKKNCHNDCSHCSSTFFSLNDARVKSYVNVIQEKLPVCINSCLPTALLCPSFGHRSEQLTKYMFASANSQIPKHEKTRGSGLTKFMN